MKKIILFIICTAIFANDKIFVVCEGNFYYNDGSLWEISDNQSFSYNYNPIGQLAQSIHVHHDNLYAIINGSGNIIKYKITANGIVEEEVIDTNGSGPRELVIYDNYLYFTNWYTADVKKINLLTSQIENSIDMPGLPEDIIIHNDILYISITMNHDWTDGNQVVSVDPEYDSIIQLYDVGPGPGELLIHDNDIYISRTYYDDTWNSFYGTSRINTDNEVEIANYGTGIACGGGIYSYQNSVYRVYNGGIAKLDENLQILPDTRIGGFEADNVYSAAVFDEYIYFGLSDYVGTDEVITLDYNGNQINQYEVGTLPGDFDIWRCDDSIDINQDSDVNILDIISLANSILGSNEISECGKINSDINEDSTLNILDILLLTNIILED